MVVSPARLKNCQARAASWSGTSVTNDVIMVINLRHEVMKKVHACSEVFVLRSFAEHEESS